MFKQICFMFVMKKYQKLILCILAVFGTLGFLVYHSQYVKLRSTFEGFNIVGDSLWTSERCLVLNASCFTVEDEKKRLDFPPVTWINISHFYVFSSFVDSNERRLSVRAIGAGPPPDSESSLMDMECHVWMSYRNSLHSSRGMFTFSALLTSPSSPRLYEFYCVLDEFPQGTPYSLVLSDRRNRRKTFVPIKDVRSPLRDSGVLCVLPESLGVNMNSFIEFVSFHHAAGFTDVIVYDIGIHFGVLSTMASILRKIDAFKSFSVIRWDFPFMDYDLSSRLIERDCQYRAAGSAKFIVVTRLSDYIVPASVKTVASSLTVPGNMNAKAVLPAVRCCLNQKDDPVSKKTWPVALRKTACGDDPSGSVVIVNPRLDTTDSLKDGSGDVTVFKYVDCDRDEMRSFVRNTKTSAFISEWLSSDILRLWKSGKYYL